MKIISVVGARPNFMKVARIDKAVNKLKITNEKLEIEHLICHTGQARLGRIMRNQWINHFFFSPIFINIYLDI